MAWRLRKLGYRAVLNIGMKYLGQNYNKSKGHCWVTIDDKIIGNDKIGHSYAIYLGSNDSINYWMKEDSHEIRNQKQKGLKKKGDRSNGRFE